MGLSPKTRAGCVNLNRSNLPMSNRTFKYVIMEECYPMVCSSAHKHSDMGNNRTVTSAGMGCLYVNDQGKIAVSCWGESVSLKVKCNQALDEHLLTRMFGEEI